MEQELECPVCLERFQTPKVLPCQHTFCEHCLSRIIQNGRVQCPECREVHQVPSGGFRNNVTIQRLLNNVRNPQGSRSEGTHNNGAGLRPTAPPREIDNVIPYQPPAQEPRIQPVPGRHDAPRNNEAARHNNEAADGSVNCIGEVRNAIRKVVSTFLNKHEKAMRATAALFLILTQARLVAGGVGLRSACPKEKKVAIYLFVKAWFALLFWIVILVLVRKRRLIEMMDNLFIEGYVVVEATFTFIWLIFGSIWIMGNRDSLEAQCPLYVPEWNTHYINFAYFMVVVEWIYVVAFLFYGGYVIFDRNNSVENIDDEAV